MALPTLIVQTLSLVITVLLICNVIARYTFGFPLLIEGVLQIFFSELNHHKQHRRYQRFEEQSNDVEELGEKAVARTECVGAVIGYREDPNLFRKCLESYRDDASRTVRVLVIGIDGNDDEDMKMVRTAEHVFGTDETPTIPLHEPFGALAARMISDWKIRRSCSEKGSELSEDEFHDHVLDVLIRQATAMLQDHGLLYHVHKNSPPKAICICQPHNSKKEIMFSAFIFNLALAGANNIPYIWSSDSDSYLDINAAPIHRVLATMSTDPAIAGSCGALQIHNARQSTITRLISATYWTDLALTSGQNSAFDVTDCQPGPCAAFTRSALAAILVPWHAQTFLGARPLVNEDRHLSTLLLARGHKVTFHPHGRVLTDAPATLAAWIVQQVRWSRAIVLESLAHPRVLAQRHPMLALYALRRVAGPFVQAWIVVRYLASGAGTRVTSPVDIGARVLLCSVYTAWWRGAGWRVWPWLCASQVFLQFPQPPIVFWACATFLDGSWGGAVGRREGGEKEEEGVSVKRLFMAFRKTWAPLVCVAFWVGLVGAAVCKFLASVALVGDESICAAIGGMVSGAGTLYMLAQGH
ncbi:hypothetical protein SLS57_001725 [Botryosphaeria dothidea]